MGKGGRTRCRPQAREGRSGNKESYEGNLAESAKQFLKKVAHAGKMFFSLEVKERAAGHSDDEQEQSCLDQLLQ